MRIELPFHTGSVSLTLPDDATVFKTSYPPATGHPIDIMRGVLDQPVQSPSLSDLLKHRRSGNVVIVVSDITRPIPYATFLPFFIERIKAAGTDSICCPVCGYNMTGLHESRCPECGSQFTLDQLLAAQPDRDKAALHEEQGRLGCRAANARLLSPWQPPAHEDEDQRPR